MPTDSMTMASTCEQRNFFKAAALDARLPRVKLGRNYSPV